jgi:inositol phosphorylceramide mannosyltransferase catalytic subunit
MHRSNVVLLVAIVVVFSFALHSVSTLLSLLIEDAALDAVQFSELPAIDSAVNSSLPQLISKLIHQTYINASVPERWRQAQKTCVELHPDYEYKFWSNEDNLAFIEKEYPWFIETLVKYPHNIQRADAIRYFILAY